MWIGLITLFPDMFAAVTQYGITGRAIEKGLVSIEYWNPRDYTQDKHRTVDDRPYGGGPGMLIKPEPLAAAIQAAKCAVGKDVKTLYLSPQGQRLDQAAVQRIKTYERVILVAGRYEGIDERILQTEIDEEWSIGDYVLSGGELAAMVLIDAIIRLVPEALGDETSAEEDSFVKGLLDCPHYTRPEVFAGLAVPRVLLSGDHQAIAQWRLKQALGKTWLKRPDLLEQLLLDDKSKVLLQEFIQDYVNSGTKKGK